MPAWEKQPDFDLPTWYLAYDNGIYVVQKNVPGDWSAGWQPEGDPCITDETFEFFNSWQQARSYCEKLTLHKP